MKPRIFLTALTTRRRILSAAATVFCADLLLQSTGCGGGGGKKEAIADTGTEGGTGSVKTVEITPPPGTVFINRSTTFQVAWTRTTPPPTFTAVLIRYNDSDGLGLGSEQRTTLERQGDSFVWYLKRDGDYDLEAPGVYYVELKSGADVYQAAYIVSGDRSVPIIKAGDASSISATGNANAGAATVHTVTVNADAVGTMR